MTTPDAAASPITTSADRATARLLVAGQFVLLALLVVLPRRTDWPVPPAVRVGADLVSLSGLALAGVAAGTLGRGLTPMPLPNQHARLRTRGLYRHVRHPIYSGLLLFGAAHTAGSGSIPQVGILALLTGLLSGKARWEEARLRAEFPDYTAYAMATPRFVPRLRRGVRPAA
jgi:protein-S-isoprenylcysteine O-methyltransferase Ste14